jgi:hypothetical protein
MINIYFICFQLLPPLKQFDNYLVFAVIIRITSSGLFVAPLSSVLVEQIRITSRMDKQYILTFIHPISSIVNQSGHSLPV